MSFKKIALISVLSVASSAAMAAGFDGPFVQAGIGFANSQTDANAPTWFSGKLSENSLVGEIAAGYSKSFGQFNLAASAYLIAGDQKAGKLQYSTSGVGTIQFKNKNAWGVAIEPGVNVSESTLVYAKLAYVASNGQGSDNWTGSGINNSASYDQKFHGVGYGAGVKYKFSANLYALAEIQQINYQSKTWTYNNGYQASIKPNSLTGIIGVGYKF
jgi:opacity protein-like surface antigen